MAHFDTTGASAGGALATLGVGADLRWRREIGFRLDLRLLARNDLLTADWTANGEILWGTSFSF